MNVSDLSTPWEVAGMEDAEFIALARNDLDVKLRRGWHTEKCSEADQWVCPQAAVLSVAISLNMVDGDVSDCYQDGHDVGLLTKADRWANENGL